GEGRLTFDPNAPDREARGLRIRESLSIMTSGVQRKNSTFASRNHRKFAGLAEIGPLMAKTATSNCSPGAMAVLSTSRLGMLNPWIVPGLGRPAARGITPLTQISV